MGRIDINEHWGDVCEECGSSDIVISRARIEGEPSHLEGRCRMCGYDWVDILESHYD